MSKSRHDLSPRVDPALWAVSVAINLLSLALPLFILLIYDRILPNAAVDTLVVLAGALVVVVLVDAGLRLGRAHILNWNATTFEHRTNCQAVDHLLAADANDYERQSPGTHLDRLRAIQTLRAFHGSEARLQSLDLPFAAMFFLLIWAIAGPLVLVPVAIMVVMVAVGGILARHLKHALAQRAALDDKRQSFLMEILAGIQSVKGRQMEDLMLRRYERLQEGAAALTYEGAYFSQAAQTLGNIVSNLTFLAVGVIGAAGVMDGRLTIGELAAATLLSGRAVHPMLSALALWTRFQSLQLAQVRLNKLFETKLESDSAGKDTEFELRSGVKLVDVSYQPGDGLSGVADINLDVEIGEIVGIAGSTASGKRHLLRLLAGEVVPTAGQVTYDGKDVADIALPRLRSQIAHVSPTPALFKGTILENLSLFRGSGHVGRALAAARSVGLDGVVSRLPRGYETLVAAGAEDELSLGIRQMLATARAIAARPRLMLLDQVDNSLDHASGKALREALLKLRATTAIVIVSHRPSTLAIADRTYRLEHGRLHPVEQPASTQIAGAA